MYVSCTDLAGQGIFVAAPSSVLARSTRQASVVFVFLFPSVPSPGSIDLTYQRSALTAIALETSLLAARHRSSSLKRPASRIMPQGEGSVTRSVVKEEIARIGQPCLGWKLAMGLTKPSSAIQAKFPASVIRVTDILPSLSSSPY